ncbi:hypothetical protein EI94DRAFT_1706548 [Lactarius quietus]|nr:hypothetical protein EI94DRAFT_1706548 [Lactarius quietus]
MPSEKTYCWIRTSSHRQDKGGHHEMKYEYMTLWAKLMSINKATKYMLPNIHWLNHLPTKKLRTTNLIPEVVAIDITPKPEAGSSAMDATYVVSDLSSLAVALAQPSHINILVALSGLDEDEASHLHMYCRDKFLGPLLLLETRQPPRDDNSVIEIPPPHLALKQQCTGKCKVSKHIKLKKENVPPNFKLQVVKHNLKDDEEAEEQLEGINHWIDGVESGEELEEDNEALMVASMSSYNADSESGGYPSLHKV